MARVVRKSSRRLVKKETARRGAGPSRFGPSWLRGQPRARYAPRHWLTTLSTPQPLAHGHPTTHRASNQNIPNPLLTGISCLCLTGAELENLSLSRVCCVPSPTLGRSHMKLTRPSLALSNHICVHGHGCRFDTLAGRFRPICCCRDSRWTAVDSGTGTIESPGHAERHPQPHRPRPPLVL
jgi:hypothetical protein